MAAANGDHAYQVLVKAAAVAVATRTRGADLGNLVDLGDLVALNDRLVVPESWLLLIIFGASLLIFGTGYIYHLKIRLPKRRVAREMDRIQRERNDRNTAFLERLMQNQDNPSPV